MSIFEYVCVRTHARVVASNIVHMFVREYEYLCILNTICQSAALTLCARLSIDASICLSVYLSINLSDC